MEVINMKLIILSLIVVFGSDLLKNMYDYKTDSSTFNIVDYFFSLFELIFIFLLSSTYLYFYYKG